MKGEGGRKLEISIITWLRWSVIVDAGLHCIPGTYLYDFGVAVALKLLVFWAKCSQTLDLLVCNLSALK